MTKEKAKKTFLYSFRWILIILLVFVLAVVSLFLIHLYVKKSTENYIISEAEAQNLGVDCIVVLGAGLRHDGTPNHMLEDRLIQGIKLYKEGISERILMSGDHGKENYDEVNAMKQYAINKEIPSEHIFMDHAGFSTYESIYRAKEIFGAEDIVIVTQKYHLYRAIYIAKSMGLNAYGVSADLRSYIGQPYFNKREILAQIKDFFSVIFLPKPTYLGDAIPISGNGDITNDKVYDVVFG